MKRIIVGAALTALLVVCLTGCTFLQPRQVVIHAVASEPSVHAAKVPACETPSNWQATTGIINAGLQALLMTQCKLCQLGFVAERMGLVAGGVATEWMQRAQTNRVAAHRVAVPLRDDEGAPLVYTFQAPDGTVQTLIIPQYYIERAPPGVSQALFNLVTAEAARTRARLNALPPAADPDPTP